MKTLLSWTPILGLSVVLLAQSNPTTIRKVYLDSDSLVHVVNSAGQDSPIPKESAQVAVTSLQLAPNHLAAGWLIEEANCCTSYSIPVSLAIYHAGKKRIFGDGLMIYDWCFVSEGEQVALSTGTVHGMTSRHLLLYDSSTGRLLQEWNGKLDATPPAWAKTLKQ